MEISKKDVKILLKAQQGELDAVLMYNALAEVETLYPQVTLWETVTPYFEKRNIHFYVNRCGFHIVEFYNSHHPDPNDPDSSETLDEQDGQFPKGMFRFEKRIIIPIILFD